MVNLTNEYKSTHILSLMYRTDVQSLGEMFINTNATQKFNWQDSFPASPLGVAAAIASS